MKSIFVILACVVATSSASAQQAQSTALERVSTSLGQCIGGAEKIVDQLADVQKQLTAAQAKIKELEEKK